MSSRSNYLLTQTPFYSLLTFPAPPPPKPYTPDKLPIPRQRTRKPRARGLSILIPPPTEHLQNINLVISYQPSYPHAITPVTIKQHPCYALGDEVEGIRMESVDGRMRYPYTGLIFLCVGVVTLGFTMLILILIIPDQVIPIWQHHLHLST